MLKILIKNIKGLGPIEQKPGKWVAGKDMGKLTMIENAYLLIEQGRILEYGPMEDVDKIPKKNSVMQHIDASDRYVLPSFVDSHTHLVYGNSRESEFVDRLNGLTYQEIAERGGGILNSAQKLQTFSEDQLLELALKRLEGVVAAGTTALEIKSGYGLTLDEEVKMLRVIRTLRSITPLTIKSTFLGAHTVPTEYKKNPDKYVDLIVKEMIPMVAEEVLADFVDVFCDKGFFSVDETDKILQAADKYGLIPKIHANEMGYTGGIQVGVKNNALSVDHLEYTGDEEIAVLKKSKTMPTVLPGCSFFLGLPYAPVRKMIDAGLPVCVATDYNPGSSPSGNMQLIMSMAAVNYKMTPAEVINAVTINGAYAIDAMRDHGSIAFDKKANLIITKKIPSLDYMLYSYGENNVESVMVGGRIIDPTDLIE